MTELFLRKMVAGQRLFCIFGSAPFVEWVVNIIVDCGVWPGCIRSDYTTRIDGAFQTNKKEKEKTSQISRPKYITSEIAKDQYIQQYGIDNMLGSLVDEMINSKPKYPITYMIDWLEKKKDLLPELSNTKAKDPDFWRNYWQTDYVKWQSPEVSPWLQSLCKKYLKKDKNMTVYFPLCGKSVDMLWVQREFDCKVIGSDCSAICCEDFFIENRLLGHKNEQVCTGKSGTPVVKHTCTEVNIELYQADFFDLTSDIIGKFDVIIDRAALVALHPSMIQPWYLPLLVSLYTPKMEGLTFFASVSNAPSPVAPPHCYKKDQIESILAEFFGEIQHIEDYSYQLDMGRVTEPIYLLKKPLLKKQ